MYKYKIFGYNVISDIRLDCYKGDFNKPDIVIKRDSLLIPIPNIDMYTIINSEIIKFTVDGKVTFQIENGKNINYNTIKDCDEKTIVLYLLGSAFGAIMVQNGEYPLHGSSLYKNGKGVCIVGDSGAGKSSLSAGMLLFDWKVVTDDVARLSFLDEKLYVNSSYPSMKIWSNTAKKLDLNVSIYDNVIGREEKYYYRNKSSFRSKLSSLNYIFEIQKGDVSKILIEKMSLKETLEVLISNTYRLFLVEFSELNVNHFYYMSKVCKYINCYRITRPNEGFTVTEQISEIERIIGDTNEEI